MATEVAEFENVRAADTLRKFDVTAFEQQDVVQFDAPCGAYQGEPVLVAAEVGTPQTEGTTL